MYISHRWLETYLPNLNHFTREQIAESLTVALAEVEGFQEFGKGLTGIYVGEIEEVSPHPSNQKLSVCKVSIGKESKTIVCGAPNVARGQKVAVCLPGGSVLNAKQELGKQESFPIGARMMGEIESQGMICSAKELGLSNSHEGIIELEAELIVGTDLTPILTDTVYEIENKSLSHRPDCFSHKGIARELSALLNIDFNDKQVDVSIIPTTSLKFKVEKKVNEELCQRFSAIVIKDVQIKSSPLWLQARLAAIGIRAINNVVDVTNFIMCDVGQPMHAYDFDKLDSGKLTVRYARKGEKVKALDGKTYILEDTAVVIADGSKIEDIAGIMGGENSQITNETTNIVLETANWDMYSVRRTSRNLGLRTEASMKYEKGQDPEMTVDALKQAVQTLEDITSLELASEVIDIYPKPKQEKLVKLDLQFTKRFLAIDINQQEIVSILGSLNILPLDKEKLGITDQVQFNEMTFSIPSYRNDINIQQDLIEEIARIYGYANIPATLPKRDLSPVKPNRVSLLNRHVNKTLTAAGLDEIMAYSFVGKDLYNKCKLNINDCLRISNPISPELSHMRNTILPSILEKVAENSIDYDSFGMFEIGRLIRKETDADGIHNQPRAVAGIVYSKESPQVYPKIKGILETLINSLNVKVEFVEDSAYKNRNIFHPGRYAAVKLTNNDLSIILGYIGEIHPLVMNNLEVTGRVGAFELNLDELLKYFSLNSTYKQLSIYQAVKRDLSFWISSKTQYAQVINSIASLNLGLIASVELKDVYFDKKDENRKSLTLTIELQSHEKTLTDQEINQSLTQITDKLKSDFKVELR